MYSVNGIPGLSAPIFIAASDATWREKVQALASGGAVCDGTADQTEINAAIAACTGTQWQKVKLVGNFTIAATITMKSYVILELDGKVTLANAANVNMVTAVGVNNFKIIGGEWDGNGVNQDNAGYIGFAFNTCDHFEIDRVYIHHVKKGVPTNYGQGISGVTCTYGIIQRNRIANCGDAAAANGEAIILLTNCNYNQVLNNELTDCDGGVYIYAAAANTGSYNKVIGNTIRNIQRDGVSLYNSSGTAIFEYNAISNNVFYDVGLDGVHDSVNLGNGLPVNYNTVVGNTVYSNAVGGGIGCNGNHNVISSNTIKGVAGVSILIRDADYNIIVGNNIYTTDYGVELWTANFNLVESNVFSNIVHYGIYLVAACTYNTIIGNDVYQCDYWLEGAASNHDNLIRANNFHGTGSFNDTSTLGNIYQFNFAGGTKYLVDDSEVLVKVWVKHDVANPAICTVPAGSFVSVELFVSELFNAGTLDTLTIGYDADPDSICTFADPAIATTGRKTPVYGVEGGYMATSRAIEAYYTYTGGAPGTGEALIIFKVTRAPAP